MQNSLLLLLPPVLVALAARAQGPATGVAATVETSVALPPRQSFLRIVPIPLAQLFKAGHGLPAVTGTSEVASWDRVGLSRTVFLGQRDSARETITDYQEGRYFAYRVSNFTFAIRYLARHAVGQWWWTEESGQTKIVWRYTFVPKSLLARPLLGFFVRHLWRPYMQDAMQRVQDDAATAAGLPPTAPAR